MQLKGNILMKNSVLTNSMLAVALATGRATLAGQVEGDGPDERGCPGPPGWGLGVRLTTSPRKKTNFYGTLQ
jgi:hypothetical protein